MGGGDLNMKKSWHPLLLKNQERVWLEEKKALEEKKKLDQLRKEKEEERQLQELQRLQEEKTGKKRTEKLEWMYTTPATGSSQNANDLEDYLLGKKRVDKILTADENAKLGAAHKNFIAVQNANNARDIASKIREDPLLAIKQQEQASYEALMANPLRLREMQARNGIIFKKDKSERKREKEEKRRLKEEKKQRKLRDRYSRSPSPLNDDHHYARDHRSSRNDSPRRRSPTYGRSPSPYSRGGRRDDSRRRSRSRSPRREDYGRRYIRNGNSSSESTVDDNSRGRDRQRFSRSETPPYTGKRSRGPSFEPRSDSYNHKRVRRSPSPRAPAPASQKSTSTRAEQDRAARLAAMTTAAEAAKIERQERLTKLLEKEKADLAAEEAARAKSKGMGGFLSHESKKVFGGSGGLEDRIRRGRGGLVIDAD
ncbi:Pre-mRNA splicing factor-domain-containing protein [Rhodocollybia butyracea]|uniref:Pre-mRNA splicing factor-domain-containing protein n=1 Tax=Rhodocollybia butyracea TaxID=206335 RepID=A0A9P5UEA5_9AGAR|nr:Pre-mRNA splicing factor-domain-containing protein [Rhodocollybia butyracea]